MVFFASISLREMDTKYDYGGIYTDFNPYWFKDMGYYAIYNMVFNALWPLVEFIMWYALRHIYRMWDQSRCCKI